MTSPLRVLMIEDSEGDALLIVRTLKRAGFDPVHERVDTREALLAALRGKTWDVITSDSQMPGFSGIDALKLRNESGRDIPFIVVSGTIEEESAVTMMKAGAADYVLKHNLTRLPAAVERELGEAASRRARRAAEEEVEQQRGVLLQREKLALMGELLAGVAHELNNPLSIVTGQAGLLRRRLAGRPEEVRVEKIELAAERCARIVRNFLGLARQRPPERRQVVIATLLGDALELIAYPLRVDGIEVTQEIAEGLPVLWADGHQLQQVLINLLTNAHHALKNAQAPRRLTLRAWHEPGRDRLLIEVQDNGPGMSAEIKARIFEPFFTTKPDGEGTGLGLPLCLGLVESHAGTLSVQTEVGQGTVFRIALPLVLPPSAAPSVLTLPVAAGTLTSGRALIVDDEGEVATLLADILASAGYAVDVSHDGRAALDRMAERPYDIVLCDLRMPVMDGPSLYFEAARRHPGSERRFVFLTGDTVAAEARTFLAQVRRPHLAKPFTLDDVERVVAQVLSAARTD